MPPAFCFLFKSTLKAPTLENFCFDKPRPELKHKPEIRTPRTACSAIACSATARSAAVWSAPAFSATVRSSSGRGPARHHSGAGGQYPARQPACQSEAHLRGRHDREGSMPGCHDHERIRLPRSEIHSNPISDADVTDDNQLRLQRSMSFYTLSHGKRFFFHPPRNMRVPTERGRKSSKGKPRACRVSFFFLCVCVFVGVCLCLLWWRSCSGE